MTKPNKAGSNTPPRGKEKRITLNEDATTSRNKATKLSTTVYGKIEEEEEEEGCEGVGDGNHGGDLARKKKR
ncbi:hypothetical protein H5410_014532 [Solanum commersonii]|uniref:Uncharacterized protein n=1 Tax=Solanum commersonii TaxID=4109 RepID=A0A9J5ZRP2_SOLCO|nr:hypothetical protein H5410_014532 [Solanum commersonii]